MRFSVYFITLFLLVACAKKESNRDCEMFTDTWGLYSTDSLTINGQDTIHLNYYEVMRTFVDPPLSEEGYCQFIVVDSLTKANFEYFPYVGGYRLHFVRISNDTLYFAEDYASNISSPFKFHPATGYMFIPGEQALYRRN